MKEGVLILSSGRDIKHCNDLVLAQQYHMFTNITLLDSWIVDTVIRTRMLETFNQQI